MPRRHIRLSCAIPTKGPSRNKLYIRGEEFFAQTRRERRAYPQRSVRSEQRSLREKDLPPCGLRGVWPVASLFVSHSPLRGCSFLTPRHRPNCAQRMYSYLRDTTLAFRSRNSTTCQLASARPGALECPMGQAAPAVCPWLPRAPNPMANAYARRNPLTPFPA